MPLETQREKYQKLRPVGFAAGWQKISRQTQWRARWKSTGED